jgi:hypothetical protein
MILDQTELIAASNRFSNSYNVKNDSGKTNKTVIYILHSAEDIRLVEGLIVMLYEILVNISFRWQSGYDLKILQSDTSYDNKEKVISSDAVIFLATYKSLNDRNLMNILEFAKSADKHAYVLPTFFNGKDYGEFLSKDYCMLYIEKLRGVKKMNLKAKSPNSKNLMYTILNGEQLR